MRTIWTVIGVIVLLIILVVIYRKATNKSMMVYPKMPAIEPATQAKTVEKTTETIVIQPVLVHDYTDCNSNSYIDNVLALRDDYLQKRVIWQNAINTNDPNVIQYRTDVNDAYTLYYNQAIKCNLLQA